MKNTKEVQRNYNYYCPFILSILRDSWCSKSFKINPIMNKVIAISLTSIFISLCGFSNAFANSMGIIDVIEDTTILDLASDQADTFQNSDQSLADKTEVDILIQKFSDTLSVATLKTETFNLLYDYYYKGELIEKWEILLNYLENRCKSTNDNECLVNVYNWKAWYAKQNDSLIKALRLYNICISYAEKSKNNSLIHEMLTERGLFFSEVGQLGFAANDYRSSLNCISTDTLNLLKTYLNIYTTLPERAYDSAVYYCKSALNLAKQQKHYRYYAAALNNLAYTYSSFGQSEKALQLIEKDTILLSLEFSRYDNINIGLQHTLGKIYDDLGFHNKAIQYYEESANYLEANCDMINLIEVQTDLSNAYEKNGQSDKALKMLRDRDAIKITSVADAIVEEVMKEELTKKSTKIKALKDVNIDVTNRLSITTKLLYSIVALVLLLVGILLLRVFNNKIRKYKAEERLVYTKLIALRSTMNPHLIFNLFSTLQNFILRNENAKANRYLTQFSGLMRDVIKNSEDIYIPFYQEISFLKKYITLQKVRFMDRCNIVLEIDDTIAALNPLIPSMVIQPFIENAFVHGFKESMANASLTIDFKADNNNVYCVIKDNGVGRRDCRNIKNESSLSMATKNVRERLKWLNKKDKRQYNLRIKDIFDTKGLPCGTEVTLVFPQIIKP